MITGVITPFTVIMAMRRRDESDHTCDHASDTHHAVITIQKCYVLELFAWVKKTNRHENKNHQKNDKIVRIKH